MKKLNITKGTIKDTFKVVCTIALYGMAIAKSSNAAENMIDMVRYSGNVKYSDAVGAIMDSNMFDSRKNEALELLEQGKDAEYYKTVIRIVKSDMFDSNKIRAITNLNTEEEV